MIKTRFRYISMRVNGDKQAASEDRCLLLYFRIAKITKNRGEIF
jgi:hypothetical protein